MNRFHLLVASSILALASTVAHADTVVNLNGSNVQDGNVFYKTLNSSNLAVGTYTATFVGQGFKASDGTTAAYSAYSKYTPASGNWQESVAVDTAGGTFTAVNDPTNGLENNFTANGATAFGSDTHYATAALALAAQVNAVYTFTIGKTGGITFFISDNAYPSFPGYGDNFGGISLDVKAAPTPEPSSLILLGTGALSLAGAVRRKLRA